jgi:hypothetical protein
MPQTGRFCPRCGTGLEGDWLACPSCGRRVEHQDVKADQPERPAIPYGQPASLRRRRSIAGPFFLAMLLAVVMLMALGIPQQLLGEGLFTDGSGFFSQSYTAGSGSWVESWTFEGDDYTLRFSLPDSDYEYYLDYEIERGMRFPRDYEHGLEFVTGDSSVIVEIAASMGNLSAQAGLDEVGTANLVLSFVQSCIPYALDTVTYGVQDYWAFPLETLHNGQGDCEDKSFLYASIMIDLDYHAALLFYEDHLATGIGAENVPSGTYYAVGGVNYYYCETTSPGWTLGEIPEEYSESHVIVVP